MSVPAPFVVVVCMVLAVILLGSLLIWVGVRLGATLMIGASVGALVGFYVVGRQQDERRVLGAVVRGLATAGFETVLVLLILVMIAFSLWVYVALMRE